MEKIKNDILTALTNHKNNEVKLISDGWQEWLNDDSWVVMFKVNGHNVYRIILYSDSLYFQCINYAFYVSGEEYYDEAVDYKSVHTDTSYEWFKSHHPAVVDDDMLIDNDMSFWPTYVVDWVDECERDNPNYTEYENE